MKITALLLSIILLPTICYSASPDFSAYMAEGNKTHQYSCDADSTKVEAYQNKEYFLQVATPKSNTVYYIFSKNMSDPHHFFIRESKSAAVVEMTKAKWLEKLKAESSNMFKYEMFEKNDCSTNRITK